MDMITNVMKGLAEKLVAMIPPSVMSLYAEYRIPVLVALIAISVLLSLEGYKIFKGSLYLIVPTALAFVGFKYVVALVIAQFGASLPALPLGISYEALIPFVLAVIGVILVKFAYKFTVMLLGGTCGFAIGYFAVSGFLANMFPTLTFLTANTAKAIIGLVFAAILGVAFILFFKHAFILITAIGCMVAAGYMACLVLMPEAPENYKLMAMGLGAVIGIYSTIHQYNEEQRATDIRFYT